MGYNFTIGNAKPYHRKEDDELVSGWEVEAVEHPDAPTFPHDEMTKNTSYRCPSYTAWHEFCYATGVAEVFYDKEREGHLKAGHPGCQTITHHDLEVVRLARKRHEATATLPPGFAGLDWNTGKYIDEGKYDPLLARLIWLDWWMDWALKNCETPAIENS